MPTPAPSEFSSSALADELRRDGFPIGLDHILRFDYLYSRLNPESLEDLKRLLGPVVATSEEEQDRFKRAFERLYDSDLRKPEATSLEPRYRYRFRAWAWAFASLAILLATIALVLYKHGHRPSPQPPNNNARVDRAQAKESAHDQKKNPTADVQPPTLDSQSGIATTTVELAVPYFREVEPDLVPTKPGAAPLAVVAAFTLTFLGVFFCWQSARRKQTIADRRHRLGGPYDFALGGSEKAAMPYTKAELDGIAVRLSERFQDDNPKLNIKATVNSTVSRAGFMDLQYREGDQEPEYLLLLDRQVGEIAELVRTLSAHLANLRVPIRSYSYSGDPRVVFDPKLGAVRLASLDLNPRQTRLLFLTRGDGLLDPVTGGVANWVDTELICDGRVVLTPTPPVEWGNREWTLSQRFQLVTASLAGIEEAISRVSAPSSSHLRFNPTWGSAKVPREAYAAKQNPVLTIRTLSVYLGEGGLAWLSACALLPRLEWPVVAALGSVAEIGLDGIPPIRSEETTLRLLRLPYFQRGELPIELRQRLVGRLPSHQLRAAATALLNLLEMPESEQPEASFAAEDTKLTKAWLATLSGGANATTRAVLSQNRDRWRGLDPVTLQTLGGRGALSAIRSLLFAGGVSAFGPATGQKALIAAGLTGLSVFIAAQAGLPPRLLAGLPPRTGQVKPKPRVIDFGFIDWAKPPICRIIFDNPNASPLTIQNLKLPDGNALYKQLKISSNLPWNINSDDQSTGVRLLPRKATAKDRSFSDSLMVSTNSGDANIVLKGFLGTRRLAIQPASSNALIFNYEDEVKILTFKNTSKSSIRVSVWQESGKGISPFLITCNGQAGTQMYGSKMSFNLASNQGGSVQVSVPHDQSGSDTGGIVNAASTLHISQGGEDKTGQTIRLYAQTLGDVMQRFAKGFDLSGDEGDVDFAKARAAGFSFVYLRAVEYSPGLKESFPVDSVRKYYASARKAGLLVGFDVELNSAQSIPEQSYAYDEAVTGSVFGVASKGIKPDLPTALDVSNLLAAEKGPGTQIDSALINALIGEFGNQKNLLIYFPSSLSSRVLSLKAKQPIYYWIAQYGSYPTTPFVFWQGFEDGHVPGVPETVGIDVFLGTEQNLRSRELGNIDLDSTSP